MQAVRDATASQCLSPNTFEPRLPMPSLPETSAHVTAIDPAPFAIIMNRLIALHRCSGSIASHGAGLRSLSQSVAPAGRSIEAVTVFGSGLMGSGIAQVAAASGHKVTMVDLDEGVLSKAMQRIESSLTRVAGRKYKDDSAAAADYVAATMGNLTSATDVEQSVEAADLAVEAVPEQLEMKHSLFARVDAAAPEHTILASNTSSLRIGDIASVTNRKDRFGGLHFFNPVPMMKLVEVIRTADTSQETFDALKCKGLRG